MAEKQKADTMTSPKGVFVWPKLTVADTKFKAEGEYGLELRVSKELPEVKALIARLDKAAEEALAGAKKNAKTPAEAKKWETKYRPYKFEEDAEGNETGNVLFKATMKATGVSKKTGKPWERKPAIFDARGKPVTKDITIGNGSVGKFFAEITPYASTVQSGASVKLSLVSVQVIELKSYGERSASEYGFGSEEGGWSADGEADDTGFGDETAGGEADDTTDF